MTETKKSTANSSKATPAKERNDVNMPSSEIMAGVIERMTKAVSDADEAAAAKRVDNLRTSRPTVSPAELVDLLIHQKCLQTGAVGAITSGSALVPGLGTVTALTFGVAADIGMTFKMQAELVLEIAAVYERKLSPDEKRTAVMLVTGISTGANQLLEKAGEQIARKATERLAQKSVTKALPLIGVAASAGSNIVTTYVIGQRARAYFGLSPEAMGDWAESIRALTGVDERVMIEWLIETTERSWQVVSNSAKNAVGAVIVAGKSTGEVIVISAGKVSEAVSGASRGVLRGISSTTGKLVETGKWAGSSVAATANAASSSTLSTGKWALAGLSNSVESAAGAVVDAGKKAGTGLASGTGKVGEIATNTGRNVTTGASSAAAVVAGAGKKARQGVVSGAGTAARAVSGIFKRKKVTQEQEQDDQSPVESDQE